ncbi:MAG: MFS transporter [Anaerovoracaceae bacterium]
MTAKKLSVKTKLGYGIGQLGDSLGYNVFYYFFLFFLTDIAGVSPAIAGTISFIAVLWDAITDPVIGYMSDHSKSKMGRRRSFMISGALPYGICMFLLFSDIDLSPGIKGIYFIIIAMAFWTCYTVYVIPYFALGGELTDDFEERTSVRAWASVFMYVAVFLASATPPMIVGFSEDKLGLSTSQGWRNVGIIFGVIILVIILICWACTKGKESTDDTVHREEIENAEKKNIFLSYWEILKLKPVKFLGGSVLLWALVCSAASSGPVYMMTNNFNLSAEKQSLFFTLSSVFALMWIPVINFLCKKFDKKHVYCVAMMTAGIALCIFGITGVPNLKWAIMSCFCFTFGNTAFWTLYFSLMYDLNEVDEYVNGERREGATAALLGLCQKLGAALGLQLLGIFLQIGGYGNPQAQSEIVEKTILYANTYLPGVLGILAAVVIIGYPITKSRHSALVNALKCRNEGKSYSEEGFAEVLNKKK